jgi:hypothetical protein
MTRSRKPLPRRLHRLDVAQESVVTASVFGAGSGRQDPVLPTRNAVPEVLGRYLYSASSMALCF